MSQIDIKWTVLIGVITAMVLVGLFISLAIILSKKQRSHHQEKISMLQKYHTLVESMNDSVFVVDKALRFVLWNQNFLDNFGVQITDNIKSTIWNIFDHVFAEKVAKEVTHAFKKHSFHRKEILYKQSDANQWFEMSFDPQFNSNNEVESVLCISRDITDRRIMEIKQVELIGVLKTQQKTLQFLSKEVIRAQEEERARISREIHDGIGQALTAITFNLELLDNADIQNDDFTARVKDCKKLVERTMDDVHRFANQLRPAIIDDLGLVTAFKSDARKYKDRTGVDIQINSCGKLDSISEELKIALYRIFQESLTNIAKHAQASKVRINIEYQGNMLYYCIEDNGKGFNADKVLKNSAPEGLGLKGIRERLELIGGHMELISKPQEGTKLSISIPYVDA